MSDSRPYQVKGHHLDRLAIVYLRQSTMQQVEQNTGSTAYQYAQAEHARRWGWTEERIVILDEDLGLSGTSTVRRTGWQTLFRLVGEDKVGLILFSETSRVNRNTQDFDVLLRLCEEFDVLLAADGHILDPKEPNDFTMGLLQSIFAQHENRTRTASMRRAKETKAKDGIPVTHPPVGYIEGPDRTWVKDPDERVRAIIPFLFHEYLRLGSILRLAKELLRRGIEVPAYHGGRLCGRETKWSPAYPSRIGYILRNPAYCGDYLYRPGLGGRARGPRGGKGRASRKAPPEKWYRKEDTHEAYVPRALWEEVQARRAANADSWPQPTRHGDALLLGVAVCAVCGLRMQPTYSGGPGSGHYQCNRGSYGVRDCGSVVARLVDPVVVEHLLRRLEAPGVGDLLAVLERADETYAAIERQRARELAHAEYEAGLAERRYKAEDPENRLVVATLGREWEEKLRHRDALQRQQAATPIGPRIALTADDRAEILAMPAAVPGVWSAPTTTVQDHRKLLRLLVEKVRLGGLRTEEVSVAIQWVDATVTTATVLKPRGVWRVIGRMREANMSYQAIAAECNRLGLQATPRGPFTPGRVMRIFNTQVKPPPEALSYAAAGPTLRELHAQKLTYPEMARRLNALGRRTPRYHLWSEDTVRRGLKELGLVRSRAAGGQGRDRRSGPSAGSPPRGLMGAEGVRSDGGQEGRP